jgi:hypothetical protein
MNRFLAHGRWIAAIACVAMITPRAGWSSESIRRLAAPENSPHADDVRLDSQRRLWGQLLDRQGRPRPTAQVSLWSRGQLLARTRTRADGAFHFDQMSGGVYRVAADDSTGVYRVWTPNSAPPTARTAILLVDGAAVRGQQGGSFTPAPSPPHHPKQRGLCGGHYDGAIMRTLCSPWVVGGLIAAGIAIPLALSDDAEGS